jgi:predicted DNA binding CopG/RHH family protein
MKDIPVYRFPAEHARENGELELYRASNKANTACKEAIEKSISEHYCDNVLRREAVAQVAEQFGHERILYVLAITIRQKDWDGRFSADNKQWAKTVPVSENPDAWGTDRNCYLAVNSHSGLVDLFTKLAREDARAQALGARQTEKQTARSGGGDSQKDKGAVPVSAQFMRRNIRISVRLTEEEHRLLKEKMARIGVTNQEAFLRKMALDGLVIRLDLPELKQMISLLRYTSNNINQIAKRLNESGRAYDTDLTEILEKQKQLWGLANKILMKLSTIQ